MADLGVGVQQIIDVIVYKIQLLCGCDEGVDESFEDTPKITAVSFENSDAIANNRKKITRGNNLGHTLKDVEANLSPSGEEIFMIGIIDGLYLAAMAHLDESMLWINNSVY